MQSPSNKLGGESIRPSDNPRRILVLGATGYIGGRLVPRLLQAGHQVRAAVRSVEKIRHAPWAAKVDIHSVDLADGKGLEEALESIDVVYHLVHSMSGGRDFEQREAETAQLIADSAHRQGVDRIIFLGGLHPNSSRLSPHMRSRAEVARIFVEGPVDTVAFQAGIIIGSGSASFEMIRHLALALRVMPAPNWVSNRVDPLGIRDVLYYLLAAADSPDPINQVLDIGSGDVMSYAEVMTEFARAAGLKRRWVIPLPLPAAFLSGVWVGLVTPLPMALTIPLVQSLHQDAVTTDHAVDHFIEPPPWGLLNYTEAVTLALRREQEGVVETTWDADVRSLDHAASLLPSDPDWAGRPRYEDSRRVETHRVTPEAVWAVVESIGGTKGWYSWPLAWKVRGVWDKLLGGAGLNRGRRLAESLRVGDPVDWWRVESIRPGHRLVLRAEMKVAGDAWLEFEVEAFDNTQQGSHTGRAPGRGESGVRLTQRAVFYPRNLRGRAYWLSMAPFHRVIFPTMLKNIIAAAEDTSQANHRTVEPTSDLRSPLL